jgi:hypothetical protein
MAIELSPRQIGLTAELRFGIFAGFAAPDVTLR